MNLLDHRQPNIDWKLARKTKCLRAKPMIGLIVDESVMSKFLIDTLEGREPIAPENMFCIGELGDAWQQTPKKLLAKYNVLAVDKDGWLVCQPKPENKVEFVEIDANFLIKHSAFREYEGHIIGQWGETIDGVPNLQAFRVGDFMARNPEDKADVWIVRRKIWENSYVEITE